MSEQERGGRLVVTKHRTYHIPADVKGMPIEEYLPDTNLPDTLKGAKVYLTKDGPVIARQLPEDD